jgi:hypothetical protein
LPHDTSIAPPAHPAIREIPAECWRVGARTSSARVRLGLAQTRVPTVLRRGRSRRRPACLPLPSTRSRQPAPSQTNWRHDRHRTRRRTHSPKSVWDDSPGRHEESPVRADRRRRFAGRGDSRCEDNKQTDHRECCWHLSCLRSEQLDQAGGRQGNRVAAARHLRGCVGRGSGTGSPRRDARW